MIREIIHDPIVLIIGSKDVAAADVPTAELEYHKNGCVGTALNKI